MEYFAKRNLFNNNRNPPLLLNYISNKVLPIFMNYIMSEMKNISTDIINKTVSNELSNFNDNLIYITKNSNDEIQTIDYNSNTANKILVSITDDILNNLKSLENDLVYTKESYSKGIIYTIPLGSAFENVFIEQLSLLVFPLSIIRKPLLCELQELFGFFIPPAINS